MIRCKKGIKLINILREKNSEILIVIADHVKLLITEWRSAVTLTVTRILDPWDTSSTLRPSLKAVTACFVAEYMWKPGVDKS
jgi:hypothetical protein